MVLAVLVPAVSVAQPAVRPEAPVTKPEAPGYSDWKYLVGVKGTRVGYSASSTRDSATEASGYFDADQGQTGGFGGGYGGSNVKFKAVGVPSINQKNANLSGRLYQRDTSGGGRIIYRLDYLSASNNDTTRLTDRVRAVAPKIGFLNKSASVFLDLEFARTSYPQSLSVNQFSPTIGFDVSQGYDWINLRPILIRISDSTRALGNTGTSALDVTWIHYFAKPGGWSPSNVSMGALLGKRMYGVDTATGSISNSSHLQRGGLNFGLNWKMEGDLNLGFNAGRARFDEAALVGTSSYTSNFFNVALSKGF